MSINSDAINSGLNYDKGTWIDNRYVRCARCGFICHLDRDMHSTEGSPEGWGKVDTATTVHDETALENRLTGEVRLSNPERYFAHSNDENRGTPVYDHSEIIYNDPNTFYYPRDYSVYDPVVTKGCPQCGCLLYNK